MPSVLSCREEENLVLEPKEGKENQEEPRESLKKERKEEEEEREEIWVHVSGAVQKPGVYRLKMGARAFEAVEAAGGFADQADTEWLNQAAPLEDGEKLQIYTREETAVMEERGESSESFKEPNLPEEETKDRIDINAASLEELQEIPGIGEARARAIIDYREEAGAFDAVEEIQEVPGIKGKTFEKIEDYIIVK